MDDRNQSAQLGLEPNTPCSDSSMDDRNPVSSQAEAGNIKRSDSSMDDRNPSPKSKGSIFLVVQIPLWTIGTG